MFYNYITPATITTEWMFVGLHVLTYTQLPLILCFLSELMPHHSQKSEMGDILGFFQCLLSEFNKY